MATSQAGEVIERLRRAVFPPDGGGLTDGQLLTDYLSRHDEAALAALVRRHAPMVWGVCRRVLNNHHDAEDAFQATFLVLVRKAASIASRELLPNWLYGVAHQTALKARATAARRKGRERQVAEMPEPAAAGQDLWGDLQPLLDQELSGLPEKYRVLIVLCDLEGKTGKEAARQLGCPEGTVRSRLTRARAMLAKRLTQRGVALSGGALAAVLTEKAASAGVPNSVVKSTIRAASLVAAGKAASGTISVKVAALTEGVMKAMLFTRLKSALAVVLILGILTTGATILTCRTAAGQDDKEPAAEKPVEPAAKQKKEAFTAWGKEINGLQAGLGFRPGENRAYHYGEKVTLVIRVRNVGKETVKFSYLMPYIEHEPIVTGSDGKRVPQPTRLYEIGERNPGQVELPPGKEIELHEIKRELKPASESGDTRPRPAGRPHALYGTGKVKVQYEQVFGDPKMGYPEWKLDPALSDLATGNLALEVKDAEKLPQKQEKEKEGFTAWGKEVGGVQAGIGFRPGEQRAYRTGETVRLVVRVRNVGKQAVKFVYAWEHFYDGPPLVTDAVGKPVSFKGVLFSGEIQFKKVILMPGKEVDLCELNVSLRPASEKANARPWSLYETGKFQLQFERVGGNIGTGEIKYDPILSKLVTGKLELEVKDAEKEASTAWGKEVGGLQAGLGYKPGEKRAYHHGEEATVVLRVRNVGKEAVEFKHIGAFFVENPPTITDADGKGVKLPRVFAEGLQAPHSTNVAPGKEVELYEWNIHLLPKGATSKNLVRIHGTGEFSLQCKRIVGPTSGNPNHPNPTLDKLATGKLELEVKDAEKLPDTKQEKEAFTVWGKEVGGLQAGLGYKPGEKRAYSHGETVTLVIRVRNVGKKAAKFEYLKQFFMEMPPTVTDGEGKLVPRLRYEVSGEVHLPVEVSLAPGKEIELYEWNPELKAGNKVVPDTLWASGKVNIQYKRLFGNTGAGQLTVDPALSKLATGTLELEIEPAPPPAQGFVPAPEGPVMEKAIYFVGKQGGELSADDLKKHPEVKSVHTFADLQRFAGKGKALWIDVTAIPLLQGEKEQEWVIRKAREEYTFAMIGCNEFLCCFRDKLDCFGISGPGPIDWTKYDLSPGFSVIRQREEKVGKEVHVTGNGRGYQVVPTVQKVLNVTDRLLAGETAPEAP